MTAIAITVFAVFSTGKAFTVKFEASRILAIAILSSSVYCLKVYTLG
jgi:hypothetical protein